MRHLSSRRPPAIALLCAALAAAAASASAAAVPCVDGMADVFPCDEVDLLAQLPLPEIGGGTGSDLWGWTDAATGSEYALVGRSNGTAFVDLSDPENPVYVANLPTHAGASAWRDIKVYRDHAFIVADFAGAHGLQIVDLTTLRRIADPPAQLAASAHFEGFDRAHNFVVNEETGFAYAVGTEECRGGLYMLDIRDPQRPRHVGCFDGDGYTHDAQCIVYRGPDEGYRGREVCFAANEDTVTVVDVTDKDAPVLLSRNGYEDSAYTHQGWLTEDHAYFIQGDEGDEELFGLNTKTLIWDMSDLENPVLAGAYFARGAAIDHNQYVRGGHTYQANYTRGLRVLELKNLARGRLREVGFFDTYPAVDGLTFAGAWSVYPFFASGAVIVSDIERGLFILRPRVGGRRLFADDFESGDLGAWSRHRGPALAVVAPGLQGSSHALEVSVDGDPGRSFLTSRLPDRERSLTVSFLLAANRVDLGGRGVEILHLRDRRTTLAALELEPEGNRYRVGLYARDGDRLRLVGSSRVPRNRAVPLTLVWREASSRTAADGVASLWRKNKRRAHDDRLANRGSRADSVLVGLPAGAEGLGGGGAFLIDDYVSTE